MTEMYISAIEADISTVDIRTVDINNVFDIACKLTQDEDSAIAVLESSEFIETHPALELDMSSIKEGFKKAIDKIVAFFKWIGEKVANLYNKIIDFFRKILGLNKKEEIKKKTDKLRKDAEKVNEVMKEDASKVKDEVKKKMEELEKDKEEDYLETIRKVSTLFVATNKLETGIIAEYTGRVLHQTDLLREYFVKHLEFSNDYFAGLDNTITQMTGFVLGAINSNNLNNYIENKANKYILNCVKDMETLYKNLIKIDNDFKNASKNIDKFTSAVRTYLNVKEEGINILVGNALIIYKRENIDNDKLERIITDLKTTSNYDVKTLPQALSAIADFYFTVYNTHFLNTHSYYEVKVPDEKKALAMFKNYVLEFTDFEAITSFTDEILKRLNSSDYADEVIKLLGINKLIIRRDTAKLTLELKKLSKVTDRDELRDLNTVISLILRYNRLLSASIKSIIKSSTNVAKEYEAILGTITSTIGLLHTVILTYSDTKIL